MPTAYQLHAGQGLESLQVVDHARRDLRPTEVRVRVRAVSLNFRDVLIYRGHYPAPIDRPIVPCSDGAGTVIEVGNAATSQFAVGDSVVGSFFPAWQDGPPSALKVRDSLGCAVDGWLAEEVVLDCQGLLRIPKGVSYITAACAPCAGVTAWVSISEASRLAPGATVLIQGTGGVAMWAARLAHASGATPIVISSDDAKATLLQPDATKRLNYVEQPHWSNAVLKMTDGKGADLVMELGGRSTIGESLRCLAFGGHLAIIGGLGGWTYESMDHLQLITKMATAHGIFVGSARSLAELLAFAAEHGIEPHVSMRTTFLDAPAAFRELEAARHVGKIVIDLA